jgi:hypothetical protein
VSVCSAIVVHANSAISSALDNDQDLALVINRLRTTDLDDSNEIKRRNGMNDLSTLAGRIRMSAAVRGGPRSSACARWRRKRRSRRARPNSKRSPMRWRGAIARQRKAGVDLDRMLTIIDGRRAVEDVDGPDLGEQRAAIVADPNG